MAYLSSKEEPGNNMAIEIFAKDPVKFVPALAAALKGMEEFEVPEWAHFVKSGVSRERPPVDDDFWFIRAASVLRQLYIKGVVGVGRLRMRYGSSKDRGGKHCKFMKSSGKIIRVILQQAEAAGLVEKVTRMQYGRRLTQAGRDLLDSIDVPEKVMVDSSEWTVASPLALEQVADDVEDGEEDVVKEKEVEEVKEEEVEEVEELKEEEEKDGK